MIYRKSQVGLEIQGRVAKWQIPLSGTGAHALVAPDYRQAGKWNTLREVPKVLGWRNGRRAGPRSQ